MDEKIPNGNFISVKKIKVKIPADVAQELKLQYIKDCLEEQGPARTAGYLRGAERGVQMGYEACFKQMIKRLRTTKEAARWADWLIERLGSEED